MCASGNTHEFKIGPGLDRAGLADVLGRQAEALAGILIPDLHRLDAAAAYEPGTLRVEAVEATERPETYRLHFRFEWSAQHGCSDWSCRDQERQSALFRLVGDAAVFEVPADPGERTTRDEF